ncbi:MIP/aquaporin family protein [Pollutibacter soli]|uniref:MIP/aquaporin family protein n=1 Tax=Pollutibacter soli TaxID=3034157 RepID=UPI003013D499
MSPFLGECIGTAILITLGDGVVANVLLKHSKGFNSGWIVITFGWAIAVFTGVYASAPSSGAHLNPAVTFALASLGDFPWKDVPMYLLAQLLGAAIGATLVWLAYMPHFKVTEDAGLKLAVFCTGPAIRNPLNNFVTEVIATFIFILSILLITKPEMKIGALDALPVALLVLGIGLSLGGPTGYAINPIRDFGPRLMHAILPIPGKGTTDWAYAWIPVLGPLAGGVLAAQLFRVL